MRGLTSVASPCNPAIMTGWKGITGTDRATSAFPRLVCPLLTSVIAWRDQRGVTQSSNPVRPHSLMVGYSDGSSYSGVVQPPAGIATAWVLVRTHRVDRRAHPAFMQSFIEKHHQNKNMIRMNNWSALTQLNTAEGREITGTYPVERPAIHVLCNVVWFGSAQVPKRGHGR
eukprot:5090056-Pyramimonas_sp.AAC.3